MAKVKTQDVTTEDLKKVKKPKVKKPRDIRSVFREVLSTLAAEGGISKVKKTWMSTKAFYTIDEPAALKAWCDDVLANAPRFEFYGNILPVVALDTEDSSLDTRLFIRLVKQPDGSYKQFYELKTDITGVCLSADGVKGIYIPINHEFQDLELTTPAKNMDRRACAEILQWFFDQVHLVFYNGKFDREIMRLTMGIVFRPYPFFEDVQVLQYINDPKADMEDKKFYTGDSGGLKALSKNVLGIEQIELEDIAKVKAETCPHSGSPFCKCTPEQRKEKENKHGLKNHFSPFPWIPVDLALWYAASDAICTWLLWERLHELARSRRTVHRIDHELVDSIAWIERQRFIIDTDRHGRTVKGHQKKLSLLENKLHDLGIAAGYQEPKTDEGVVLDKDRFNPGSTKQLQELFFNIKKFKVTKKTPGGAASCDAEVIDELCKAHPDDEFLHSLLEYRDYQALHPASLCYDPSDGTARIYLKQNVVAGGRLSSAGGDFYKDGGFGLNSQAIKKVESYLMWKVTGNILSPDEIPEDQIEEHAEEELHPSCFREVEETVVVGYKDDITYSATVADGQWADPHDPPQEIVNRIPITEKRKVRKKAPGIIHNHIGQYMGYAVCLVPGCKTCHDKFGVLIEGGKIDANEVVNLRCLFHSPPGWTFCTVDYGNIEMRAAANVSGEPEFINEFLHGKGDFHSLTASKVFPEFADPTHKNYRAKHLRDLAKIINFALLYGGTAYTIYENMKKQDPNITFEDCERMVSGYWKGVPIFYLFCQRKQAMAKDQLICTTTTGRVINFQSAMEALHIHVPSEEERKNTWKYRDLMKKAKECRANKDPLASEYASLAQSMWKNLDTGVRNCIDYDKFMGKIQRVSVNAPIQGLCGDFMRMTLNKLRLWVEKDPAVATIFILHCSVHDEIDFSVKDEYMPFVMPRITRIMKLRKLHERMQWPVPIEADAEYGSSWDVEHHVTGDDDHIPAAWTRIKAMANYLPDGIEPATIKSLILAIASGDERKIAKADAFLKENLHERAYQAAWHCFNKKKGKKEVVPQTDRKEIQRALIAALQLDEYWRLDNMPDDQTDQMETLEQYEKRMGLGPENRNPAALAFGPLGSIALDAEIVRFVPEPLGAPVVAVQEALQMPPEASEPEGGTQGTTDPPVAAESAPADRIDPISGKPPEGVTIYDLGDMSNHRDTQLAIILGKGDNSIWVRYEGLVFCIKRVAMDHIPDKFLKKA